MDYKGSSIPLNPCLCLFPKIKDQEDQNNGVET